MKYIVLIVLGASLFLACGSNEAPSTATSSDVNAIPPAAEREVRAPNMASTDTIVPGGDTLKQPDDEPVDAKPSKSTSGKVYYEEKTSMPEYAPAQTESAPPVFDAQPPVAYSDSWLASKGFADLQVADSSLIFDIRYATANNFTEAKIYDCPRCLLRPEAALALEKAQRALKRKGMGLKLFDCYRPQPYQQRLWDKVPNPDYVTPPDKGSMHSRGAAVDLTIVDAQGQELDMGTPYDFFGREAHYDYGRLPAKVLANRRLLRRTMMEAGFEGIRTEWWHFSYRGKEFPLSDFVWDCPGGH